MNAEPFNSIMCPRCVLAASIANKGRGQTGRQTGTEARTDGADHGRWQHEQRLDAAGHQAVGIDVDHPVIVYPGPQVYAPEVLLRSCTLSLGTVIVSQNLPGELALPCKRPDGIGGRFVGRLTYVMLTLYMWMVLAGGLTLGTCEPHRNVAPVSPTRLHDVRNCAHMACRLYLISSLHGLQSTLRMDTLSYKLHTAHPDASACVTTKHDHGRQDIWPPTSFSVQPTERTTRSVVSENAMSAYVSRSMSTPASLRS